MKKISAVVLNYKVKDQTLQCIEYLKAQNYKNLEIYVVDNDSGDGLAEEIKNNLSVCFIQNKQNLGYSGGNNIGIKKALEKGSDYVFILNPDTILPPDTLTKLLERAEERNAAVAGPKILFSNKKTIWFAGGVFDIANVLGGHRGVDEEDCGQYNIEEKTDYITGAALFIKKEVFEKIGLFDEKYFLYYEDSDFCFRAKQAGFKIMYIPSAVIYHNNAQSTGLGSGLQDYYITRNRMLFASKFLSIRARFALFREALKNISNPVRRMAFFDFLTGNLGKGSFKLC